MPDGQVTGQPNTFIWGYAGPEPETTTTAASQEVTLYNNTVPDASTGTPRQ